MFFFLYLILFSSFSLIFLLSFPFPPLFRFFFSLSSFSSYIYASSTFSLSFLLLLLLHILHILCLILQLHFNFYQTIPVMDKIVFLKILFYFKIENTILFSIFKILFKTIL